MNYLQVITSCESDRSRTSSQDTDLERNRARLVQLNQAAVNGQRGAARRETQDVVPFLDARPERVDSRNNVVGDLWSVRWLGGMSHIVTGLLVIGTDDEAHDV